MYIKKNKQTKKRNKEKKISKNEIKCENLLEKKSNMLIK